MKRIAITKAEDKGIQALSRCMWQRVLSTAATLSKFEQSLISSNVVCIEE